MTLPPRIKEWFHNRNVSDAVLDEFQISWDGTRIVIPICDADGKFLFNKYRRDPESEEGPKYTYDAGGTAQLFGLHKVKDHKQIIVGEGEGDMLCLWSHGFAAITSTGGAGTFSPNWVSQLLDKEVVVCMDNDDAGIKGALNIQHKIPFARIVWLPKQFGLKDVTDYLGQYKVSDLQALIDRARSYPLPALHEPEFKSKRELKEEMDREKKIIGEIMEMIRIERQKFYTPAHLELLLGLWNKRREQHLRAWKFWNRPRVDNENKIIAAKRIPISGMIQFNREGFAKCVWHQDGHPSMYYYKEANKVYCFSCSKGGDSIDVVQALKSCSLNEALDYLCKT